MGKMTVAALETTAVVLEPYVTTLGDVQRQICSYVHDVMSELRAQVIGRFPSYHDVRSMKFV